MSAVTVLTPAPIFTDIDGQPLEDGYVWLGTSGLEPQANPQTAYWDTALTQVVTQPVRTRGGYPLNGTAIGQLFTANPYSIKVQNKNSTTIVLDLAASLRPAMIGPEISSGNLQFTGAAQRITGDLSNATQANRLMFQSSTTNGNSSVSSIPNGAGTAAAFIAYNTSDPANSSFLLSGAFASDTRVWSTAAGTGAVLPLSLWVGGSEQVRIGGDSSIRSLGSLATGVPVTINAATKTVQVTEFALRFTTTSCTVTLPSAATFTGRILLLSTVTANSVTSASANVVPLGSAVAGTAILAATAGRFAVLQSDGSLWYTLLAN